MCEQASRKKSKLIRAAKRNFHSIEFHGMELTAKARSKGYGIVVPLVDHEYNGDQDDDEDPTQVLGASLEKLINFMKKRIKEGIMEDAKRKKRSRANSFAAGEKPSSDGPRVRFDFAVDGWGLFWQDCRRMRYICCFTATNI